MVRSGFGAKLRKVKADDLNLLYVDFTKRWAADPSDTQQGDYAAAVAAEIERRGKQVPSAHLL